MEAVLVNAQTTKASMFFNPADSAVPTTLTLTLGCAQLFDHPWWRVILLIKIRQARTKQSEKTELFTF